MIRIMKIAAVFFLFQTQCLQAQVRLPEASPTQTITQNFGLGKIELSYSRPSVKGRRIFGDFIEYGQVWRTGANSNTIVKFSDPVTIEGKTMEAGTYSLYTIPNVDFWWLVLNRSTKNWGTDGYNDSLDVLKIRVLPGKTKTKTETLSFQFEDMEPGSCKLVMNWDRTRIEVPIQNTFKQTVSRQLDTELQGEKKPYWVAAQFYNEYENEPAKAYPFVVKATDENPKAYWMWLYRARLEKKLGRKNEAVSSAEKASGLATAAKNGTYVKMSNELLTELGRKK